MTYRELWHAEDLARFDALLDELRATGRRMFQIEGRAVRRDGSVIWERVTGSVMELDTGHLQCIAHIEDITDRRQADEKLTYQALHDDATGLANRVQLLDRLGLAIEQLHRRPGAIAVVFVDLNRFKDVNDAYGHAAGDAVLRETGQRLSASIRSVDLAARIAGDEFVVICPDIGDVHDAVRITERISRELARPMVVERHTLQVGASAGVTITRSPTVSPEELLSQADAAMYHAKQLGQPWEVFNEALQATAVQRLAVEQDLNAALDEGRLQLHYQPVVDLRDGRIMGMEALLRLVPDGELVGPAAFIDVAEDSDLIVVIGAWVLQEACRQAAEWNERFGPPGDGREHLRPSGRPARPGRPGHGRRRRLGSRPGTAVPGDDRAGADQHGGLGPPAVRRPRRPRACTWPSTTSARATARSPISRTFPSTPSRSTGPSSPTSPGHRRTPRWSRPSTAWRRPCTSPPSPKGWRTPSSWTDCGPWVQPGTGLPPVPPAATRAHLRRAGGQQRAAAVARSPRRQRATRWLPSRRLRRSTAAEVTRVRRCSPPGTLDTATP